MPRLTKQDIRTLMEDWDSSRHIHNDIAEPVEPSKSATPKQKRYTVSRTDVHGGRAKETHVQSDDFFDSLKGSKGGYVTDNKTKKIIKRTPTQYSSEDPTPYYRQLREASREYLSEFDVHAQDNIDPFYDRYKKTQIAVASPPKIKRVPSSKPKVLAVPKIQNSSVDPIPLYHQLKEAWWCGNSPSNEDTMTGDIATMATGAVPLVAPGESEDERSKKRKKRRKLGVALAAATGAAIGTGN